MERLKLWNIFDGSLCASKAPSGSKYTGLKCAVTSLPHQSTVLHRLYMVTDGDWVRTNKSSSQFISTATLSCTEADGEIPARFHRPTPRPPRKAAPCPSACGWAWLRKLGRPGPHPTSAGAKSKTAVSGRARSATEAQCRSVALWQRLCRPLRRGGTTRHRRPHRRLASPARPRELALRRTGAGHGARV